MGEIGVNEYILTFSFSELWCLLPLWSQRLNQEIALKFQPGIQWRFQTPTLTNSEINAYMKFSQAKKKKIIK
jgi:hypothetical protein